MAFGAKIKLTVDKSSAAQSEFRSAIQSMVDSATSKSPIKVKNVSLELDTQQVNRVIADIQKAFDSSPIAVKIQKIDATSAIADLKTQIASATSDGVSSGISSGSSGGGGGGLSVKADDIIDRKRIAAAASKATAAFNAALTETGNDFASKLVARAENALVSYAAAADDTTEAKAALLQASLKVSSALKDEATNLTKVKKAAADVVSEQTRLNNIKNQLSATMKSSYGISDSSSKSGVQSDTVALMKRWQTISSYLVTGQNVQNIKQEIDALAKSANELQSKTNQLVNVQKATSGVTTEVSKLGNVWNQLNSIMNKSDLLSSDTSKTSIQDSASKLMQEWKTISETLAAKGGSSELTQQIDALANNANALKVESDQLAKIEKQAAGAASALSRLNNIRSQINSIYNGADSFRSTESTNEIQAIAESLKQDWQLVSEYVAANPLDTTTSKNDIDALAQSVMALKERFDAVKTAESQMQNTGSIVSGLRDSLQLLSDLEDDTKNISDEQTKNNLLEQRKQLYDQINEAITKTATYQDGGASAATMRQDASVTTLNTYLQLVSQYQSALSNFNTAELPYADERQKTILADCVDLQNRLNALLSDHTVLNAQDSDTLRNSVTSLASRVEEQQKYVTLSSEAATLSKKIYDYLAGNPNVANKMGTSFTNIIDSVSGANITAESVKSATKEFSNLQASAKLAGLEGQSMWQKLGDVGSILTTWISARKIITSIISMVKKMINNVTDLDAAMTELKKVTDLTATSYSKFFNTAVKAAKSAGATVSDTINATADFARLGYGVSDATQLAQAALIYKNVGDGINDISTASESLISTMKAFGVSAEDAMEIVDRFNEVGNNFAISSTGIGEAMVRSASALSSAGNTLEESIGMITAMNEVVQNPETVGTTMKTLTMYLRAAKTEAEEAGVSTDGMADSVSKLRDSVMDLTGVDIMLDEDTFKSTYQIIKEISEVWDDLTDVSQANLLNILGGKRNANSIAALITNFETAIEATETATNSAGSALKENEKYLDSVAGKTATLKASFEELSNSVVNSSLIKFFLDLTNGIVNAATALSKMGALLPVIVAGITKIALAKQSASVSNLTSVFESMCTNGTEFNTILGFLRTSTVQFTAYQKKQLATLLLSSTAFQNLTIQQKSAILTATGLQNATQAGTVTMTGFAASAKVAAQSLSMFNKISIIITILSTLWRWGSKIVNNVKQKQDDLIDSANEIIDNYSQAQETYNSNIKTLEGLRDEYDKLSKGVDSNGRNVSLTKDEYERYLEIVDQIADISPEIVSGYNDEGHAVLDYKYALEQAIAKQEEYIQNQKEIYIGSGEEVFGGKKAEYQRGLDELGKAGKELGDALNVDSVFSGDAIKAWRGALDELGINNFNMTWGTAYSQLEAIYSNSQRFLSLLRDSGAYTNEELNEVQLRISGLASSLTTVNSIEQDQVEYLAKWMQYQYEAGSLDWFGSISSAAMDEFIAGLYDINKPLMSWDDNLALAMKYGEEFATALNTEGAQSLVTMSQELDGTTDKADAYNDAIDEFLNGFEGTDAVKEQLADFFHSLQQGIEDTRDDLSELPDELQGFSKAVEEMSKGKSLLKTAIEEMSDGGLSLDTIDSLQSFLGDSESITDYLYVENGLIKLNTELWEERTKTIQQADLASLNAQLEAARQNIFGAETGEDRYAALQEYDRILDLIELYKNLDTENPLDLTSMVDDLGDVQSNAKDLIAVIDELGKAGADALTTSELNELASKYPELFGNEDLWEALTPKEQLDALQGFLNEYEETYDKIVQTRIDALQSEKDEQEALGEDVTEYDNLIRNLERMKNLSLVDLFGTDDVEETTGAYESLSDAISDVNDLVSLLNKISANEDPLETFEEIAKFIDEHPNGFSFSNFYNEDWTLKDPNALSMEWWISGIIEQCKELPGYTDAAGTSLKSMFYDALEGSEEASDGLSDLSDSMSELEKTANILNKIKSGDADASIYKDIISLIDSSDVLEFSDFFDETGKLREFGEISWNVLLKLTNQMANADGATSDFVSSYMAYIYTVINGTEDVGDELDGLSDSLKTFSSASSLLEKMKSGDDYLGTLQDIVEFVNENDGFSLTDFMNDDGSFKDVDETLVTAIFDKIIEKAKETKGWTDEMAEGIKEDFNEILGTGDNELSKFSEAIGQVKSAATMLKNIDTGDDFIGSLQEVIKFIGEHDGFTLADFVGADGKFKSSADIAQTVFDALLEDMKELPGYTEEFGEQLRVQFQQIVDGTTDIEEFTNSLSKISSAQSLLDDMQSGDNYLSTLQKIASFVKENDGLFDITDFLNADGTIKEVDDALITKVFDALIEQMKELPGWTQECEDAMRSFFEESFKVENVFNDLSEAFGEIKTAATMISDINAGSDFISTMQSIMKFLNTNEGFSFADFLNVDGSLKEIGADSELADKIFETLIAPMREMEGWSASYEAQLREQFNNIIKGEEEVNAEFNKLKNTLTAVEKVSSTLTDLSDDDTTIVDQIQSMMELAEEFKDSNGVAYDWTQWIESISEDGSSIQWNTEAILALSDAQIDAALSATGLTEKYPGLVEQIKAAARASIQAEEETNKLTEAYEAVEDVTSSNKNYGGYTQLTTNAYQELIDVDARYAAAVEYQNGVMVLNAEKHAEITQKILEETRATAEAEKQAILTSDEYKNLTEIFKTGTIDSAGMQRLLDLETQIKGYDVLAEEIDNATSAYYRWVNRKGDDGMDRYSQALEAFELINDTLNDDESEYYGRIGREEFSQAVDFVIGENVEVDTTEFDRGLELAKRYLTEGATGASNFYDDLVSHGLIDSTTGALDSSIAEISRALGVSEEMVRTMIDRINEYQTDANKIEVKDPEINTEESDSKIEQLTTNLAGVQTGIDTINATPVDVQVGDTGMLGKVSSALTSIINKIRQINSTSVSIKVPFLSTTGSQRRSGRATASGSAFAAGGKTLVGELGMETVVDPYSNRWYTVGNKGAEFVNLPKGAIVFNHLQTQDLFGFGNISSRGNSMASGNAAAHLGLSNNSVQLLDGNATKRVLALRLSDKAKGTPTKPKSNSGSSGSSKKSSSGSSSSSSTSALDTLLDKYKQINEQYEHLIAHQEFLYEEAERGYDFPGMQSSLEEQIKIYKQKAQNALDAVAEMQKQGADDTSEALQEMEEAYWAATNNMYSTFEKLNALYTDALKDKIDGIQDAYKDFADAAEEFNESGNISIDAFQKLVENGGEYLSCLEYIDGQFVINKESLEKLLAAEKEQLAIESALSYVNELKQLLTDNDANALAEMVDLSGQVSKNSWDAVYAQAALLKSAGLTDDQFAKIVKNIDALRAIANNTVADLGDGTSSTTDAYSDQKDALEEILSLTKSLIKYETDEKVDAINDQIEAYQKLVDLRKESLQTAKDENDYDEEIAEKTKEIAKLQSQIDKLALDDSREARAQRAALIEDLAEKQKELAETQSDHAYDAQTDALDNLATEYQESRQSEIDELENSISSTEKLYQLAIARINSSWDTLYDDLIAWNTEAGSSINQDITENWDKAADAVKRYGSFVAALSGKTTNDDGTTTGSSTVVATGDLTDTQALIDSIPSTETTESAEEVRTRTVKMVRVNNGKWNVRTGAGMSNKSIGIARTGDQYEYLGKKGSWYNIMYNGKSAWVSGNGSSVVDVVQKYHTGGIVGGNESAEDNEVLAILKKKETVLTEGQTNGLYKIIDFQKELADRLGHAIGSLGSPSANLMPALAGIGAGLSKSSSSDSFVFNPTINVDISGVASVNDSEARSFGSKIASTALDALQEAFTRKGITSIGNSKLKQ